MILTLQKNHYKKQHILAFQPPTSRIHFYYSHPVHYSIPLNLGQKPNTQLCAGNFALYKYYTIWGNRLEYQVASYTYVPTTLRVQTTHNWCAFCAPLIFIHGKLLAGKKRKRQTKCVFAGRQKSVQKGDVFAEKIFLKRFRKGSGKWVLKSSRRVRKICFLKKLRTGSGKGVFWKGSGKAWKKRFWKSLKKFFKGSGKVLEQIWKGSGRIVEKIWKAPEEFWKRSFYKSPKTGIL